MRFGSFTFGFCAIILVLPAAARSQSDTARRSAISPLERFPTSTWGAGVIVIDSAEIAKSTAPTFSELLQARRSGVRVFRSGGMASDGALVLLRGPTSVSGPSAPIVIVDGVRVDSRQYDAPIGGPTLPSRLDDLLPEDIERIEILSGPAAALYGDGAANGVILVTTKSGGHGPLRLSGRVTWDASQTTEHFPANFRRLGVSPTTGQPVSDCSLVAVASGQCTPTGLDVWNPLEQASPFHIGNSGRGHLEIGGETLGTSAFVGITGDARQGTLPHDDGSRLDLRGKVSRTLPWHLSADLAGGYGRDQAHLGSSILTSGLFGSAENDANRGYSTFSTLTDSLASDQRLQHATGGVRLRWQPLSWLSGEVMTGRDVVTEHAQIPVAATTTSSPPQSILVGEEGAHEEHALTTSAARVAASYRLRHQMTATTGLGYDRDVLRTLNSDTITVHGLSSLSLSQFRDRSTSFWIDQHVALTERLSVFGAVQRVTSSIFGGDAGKEWFPSANVSWAAPIATHGISGVLLRAAYAEAAGATEPLGALTFATAPVPPGSLPPPPKMERTKEQEVGADATLAGSATVSVTAFRARSIDLWVRNISIFSGALGVTALQSAEMSNAGVEALVATPLVDTPQFGWTGSLSLAVLHNEVTRMTTPSLYTTNDPIVQGHAFGGLWATPYTYADANHDGIIEPNEVQLGAYRYLGPPLPTFESALATEVRLPGHVIVSGTLDFRAGNRVWNYTEAFRCLSGICGASQDPTAPLDVQAAAVAVAGRLTGGATFAAYAQDARFTRLREIAVRWSIPTSITDAVGTRAELTIAGRNLVTWTDYRGLDPEISYQNPGILPRQELADLPLPRELVVRLEVRRN